MQSQILSARLKTVRQLIDQMWPLIRFNSRYIGPVAARARLGTCWRPKGITMKFLTSSKSTHALCEIGSIGRVRQ